MSLICHVKILQLTVHGTEGRLLDAHFGKSASEAVDMPCFVTAITVNCAEGRLLDALAAKSEFTTNNVYGQFLSLSLFHNSNGLYRSDTKCFHFPKFCAKLFIISVVSSDMRKNLSDLPIGVGASTSERISESGIQSSSAS